MIKKPQNAYDPEAGANFLFYFPVTICTPYLITSRILFTQFFLLFSLIDYVRKKLYFVNVKIKPLEISSPIQHR